MSKSNPFYLNDVVKGTKSRADGRPLDTFDDREILVIAGVHGNEHNAVLAAYRLYQLLKGETVPYYRTKHKVRFMLGVNTWGLLGNKREWGSMEDIYPDPMASTSDIDFNRVWSAEEPMDSREYVEMRRSTVMDCIHAADIVIDVHNSCACDNMVVINNDEYAASTVKFLNDCGMRNYMVWESNTNTIKKYAIDHGKTAFTVELGGMTLGAHNDAVMVDQTAFLKTLVTWLDDYMPTFERGEPLSSQMLSMPICSHAFGMIDTVKFSHFENMKTGDTFATMVTDSDNPGDGVFKAPCDGRLVACQPTRFVKPGDEIFTWQPAIEI